MKLYILLVFIFMGCASQPKVWLYPDFVIIKANKETIQDVCYVPGGTFDDGTPQVKDRIKCCWKSKTKEIWISEWSPECLLHELCHQQGIPKDVCGRDYRWD